MPKRILDEELKFSVIINGNKAQKELYDLEKATRKLNATNKNLRAEKAKLFAEGKRNTAEYKRLTAEIKTNSTAITANKQRMAALQKEIGITGLTMAQLRKRAAQLRIQLNNTIPKGAAYKRYSAELKQINLRMMELRTGAAKTKLSISSLAQGFNKYAVLGASVLAGATSIVLGLQKIIDYNGKLSDSQADVMKTTGMTKKEVDELTKSFGLLKTRTSRIDLLKIAEAGGRIGLVGEEVKEFVKVMNVANVALGDTFQGGAEEVAAKLGKLKFLFKETKDLGVDEAYNAIGSAINELGANGIATEANIAAFTTRVGALPDALKPSIADALALGAAFDESGLMVENAGRAYDIFMGKAAINTDKFAEQMNMTEQEVKDLINTNPTEFFLRFSESLAGVNEDGVEMSRILKDLGLNASTVKKIVGAAANNTERFREMIDLSNQSMIQGTSLLNEYNIKNNNLAATLAKIKKTAAGWFSSTGLVKFLEKSTYWFGRLIGAVAKSTDSLENERLELLKLESKIKDVNIKENDRLTLIKEFQKKYPEFLKNLDAEKVTNQELTTAIRGVNEQLINKIILQEKDTEIAKQNETAAYKRMEFLEQEDYVREKLVKLSEKRGIKIKDNATLQEQASYLITEARKKQHTQGGRLLDQITEFGYQVNKLKILESQLNTEINHSNQLSKKREELAKRLNITLGNKSNQNTNEGTKKPKEGDTMLIDGQIYIFKGGKWILKKIVPTKDPNADNLKKTSIKKEQEELLRLQRQFKDAELSLLDEGYQKEKAKLDEISQRKIADLQARKSSQKEIDAAPEDLKQILLAKNKEIDALIEQEERLHNIKLGTIQERAGENELQRLNKQYERQKILRTTNFNNELAEITTLEQAKSLLKAHLSEIELKKLTTLEQAKQALTDKFNKDELIKEAQHLQNIVKLLESALKNENFNGIDFTLLTPEQEQEIIEQIERLKLQLSELKKATNLSSSDDESDPGDDMESVDFGEVDILGFTPDNWIELYSNLEQGKIGVEAISMAVTALGNLWSQYNAYVEAGENAQLAKYEKNANRRKKILKNQLDNGQISQEEYSRRVQKIDDNLDRQKAEIEYKQAKRQKEMALIQVAINTAQAIMSIWAQVPKFDFGISAGILTGVVTALGALQAVTIAKQPLPARGFEEGLYNTIQREQDGKLFNARFGGTTTSGLVTEPTYFLTGEKGPEMIIDADAYKQMDPAVRHSMNREVARVKGFESGYYSQTDSSTQTTTSSQLDNELLVTLLYNLEKNNDLLDYLKENGIQALVSSRDMQSMKNLKQGIKDYDTIRNQNKM